MRHYRVYSLDPEGHICLAREVQCKDDLDALAEAEMLSQDDPVEVWEGGRIVARLKKGNEDPAATDRLGG